MLSRGWQLVEGTGNRARTGEYGTEETWVVGGVMGSSQAIKSPTFWSNVGRPEHLQIQTHRK